MATFSVNQNRQLYVANSYNASVTAASPAGTIGVKADKNKKSFYFIYKGADTLMRSDLIDVKSVEYAKATDADSLVKKLKTIKVELDANVNGGAPISGQDYILRIVIHQAFGNSDGNQYIKYGAVHGVANMTASDFYKKLAISLAKNFSREITPFFKFALSTSSTTVSVDAFTKESALTETYTGVIIQEVEQPWVLGTRSRVPVYFDVIPTTVISEGDEVIWGTTTDITSDTNATINNGKDIADLEYFCMGERGDQYRGLNWPNVIPTKYLVNPDNAYNTLDIHFAYVGDGVHTQKSEKDITIVVPKVGANNKASNALINSIITAVNTATGLEIESLDVSGS